jgi:MSHA biogenesis protein MshE
MSTLEKIDLGVFRFDPETVRQLPEAVARRHRAIALEDRGVEVLVGLADPTDLAAFDAVSRFLNRDVQVALVDGTQLSQALDRVYRRTGEIASLAGNLGRELGPGRADPASVIATAGGEDAPVVRLLQSLFDDASQVDASDIHIEPQEDRLQIRFRIDGVLYLQAEVGLNVAAALALRLKLMAGLDIAEKRLPQDGRFVAQVRQRPVDVRISTMPTQFGESVVMRLLDRGGSALRLDAIGLPPSMLERLRGVLGQPSGMVLVTGPTGSGKTTTLYGALSELNTSERKIITVEDPVEYRLPGVNQVQVNEKIELDFARVLRSALRQDPDVLLVGELRDAETAQIGIRAAMTGHLVLSTLHTNNAASTPMRFLDMGVPGYLVASSLQAVVAQRLVRLVCAGCAEVDVLTAAERQWLEAENGMDMPGGQFRRGKGCAHCSGSGFRGRTGVFEMLEMTPALAAAAAADAPAAFITAARAQIGANTLRRHALELAQAGRTTVGEVMHLNSQLER